MILWVDAVRDDAAEAEAGAEAGAAVGVVVVGAAIGMSVSVPVLALVAGRWSSKRRCSTRY